MAYTQAQVDTLEAAIARGVTSVRNANGEMVQYRSLAEMREILSVMKAGVAGEANRGPRVGVVHYVRD